MEKKAFIMILRLVLAVMWLTTARPFLNLLIRTLYLLKYLYLD